MRSGLSAGDSGLGVGSRVGSGVVAEVAVVCGSCCGSSGSDRSDDDVFVSMLLFHVCKCF